MSVANELTRIANAKKDLAEKAAELGLKFTNEQGEEVDISVDENGTSNGKIDDIAEAFNTIDIVPLSKPEYDINFDNEDAQILITVTQDQDGYVRKGTSTNSIHTHQLANHEIIPIKNDLILPTRGMLMAKDILIKAIPDEYTDVSSVTATADTVLEDSIFVASDGTPTEGTMPNKGAIDIKLQPVMMPTQSYTIPKGYHNGEGRLYWEQMPELTITPTKEKQLITADIDKFGFMAVTVNPIPEQFIDPTDITKGYDDLTIHGAYVTIPAGYYPTDVLAGVGEIALIEKTINPLEEPEFTDEYNRPLLVKDEVNKYVCKLRIRLDPAFEEALAAI